MEIHLYGVISHGYKPRWHHAYGRLCAHSLCQYHKIDGSQPNAANPFFERRKGMKLMHWIGQCCWFFLYLKHCSDWHWIYRLCCFFILLACAYSKHNCHRFVSTVSNLVNRKKYINKLALSQLLINEYTKHAIHLHATHWILEFICWTRLFIIFPLSHCARSLCSNCVCFFVYLLGWERFFSHPSNQTQMAFQNCVFVDFSF